ncbi:MAG: MFS transporter [Alphaproteobacteria bacterium]|nr:MFS transporter [Alphaproteobacteria bacterium]
MTTASSPSLRAWAAFLLGCACFGYAFLQRVAPSVMTDDLMRAFQVQAGALGAMSAFYFYAYAGMQMPIGVLMDRFGPRRLLSGAMALCLVGSLVFALAESITPAAVGRTMIGAAVAFGYVGTMSIAATWFPPQRFSLLIGILQSVGMSGAIAGQAPLSLVVEATGWRETVIGIGIVGAVLAVLIFLVVEEIPSERKAAANGASKGAFRDVLARRDSWCCAIIGFTLTAPMLAFAGLWAVPWLIQVHGFSPADAAGSASLIFVGWAVVGPMIGLATEKIGRRKPLIYGGFALSGTAMAAMIFTPDLSPWAIRTLFVLNGIGGCTMILTFTCVRETNRPSRAGAGLGFVNMFVVGSGALFQPLLGVILDQNWDGTMVNGAPVYDAAGYQAAFSALLVAYGIGLLATIILRETHCRQAVTE